MKLYFVFLVVFKFVILSLTSAEAKHIPVFSNCSLVTDTNIQTSLQKAFDKETLVIYATVSIAGETGAFSEPHVKTILDPTKWIFTKDETARSILLFKEQYILMSLYTLALNVDTINIEIKQQPADCLGNRSVDDVEYSVRLFLIGLIDATKAQTENVHICNKNIVELYDGKAEIKTFCCQAGLNEGLYCKELKHGFWLIILRVSAYFLIVLLWGFCVYARPLFLYERTINVDIKHNFKLRVNRTSDYISCNPLAANSFKDIQNDMADVDDDGVKEFEIKFIQLHIETRKLSKPESGSTGFFKYFWDLLFWCDVRSYSESTSTCCDEQCFYLRGPSWHSILSFFKLSAVVLIIILPVVVRLIFLFKVSKPFDEARIKAMNVRNLTITFTDTLFLDKFWHLYGIKIAWVELVTYAVLFVILVPSFISKKCNIERVCFKPLETLYERRKSQRNVCNTFMKIALHRCRIRKCSKFGILNICLLPFSFLFAILYVIYRIFPTVHVLFHMMKSCVTCTGSCDKSEEQEEQQPLVQDTRDEDCNCINTKAVALTFLVCCLLWLFLFFINGGIFFYIQCGVYTITGILLNYNFLINFIGPVIFILLYGNSKLQAVHKQLQTFENSINKSLLEAVPDINQFVHNSTVQENQIYPCACIIQGGNANFLLKTDGIKLEIKNGGILFFLRSGETVKPFISKHLMYHLSALSHPSCPGSPLWLYLEVVTQVLVRAMIVAFILNILLAVEQELSSAMKTLFVFLTGYIVTSVKQFYIHSHPMSSQEIGYWTDVFASNTNELEHYKEIWTVHSFVKDTSQPGSHSIEIAEESSDTDQPRGKCEIPYRHGNCCSSCNFSNWNWKKHSSKRKKEYNNLSHV